MGILIDILYQETAVSAVSRGIELVFYYRDVYTRSACHTGIPLVVLVLVYMKPALTVRLNIGPLSRLIKWNSMESDRLRSFSSV